MDIRKELKSLQTTESNIEALEECAEEYEKIFGAGNAIIRYINSIPDEEIRSIIRLRYQKRNPYTWGMSKYMDTMIPVIPGRG